VARPHDAAGHRRRAQAGGVLLTAAAGQAALAAESASGATAAIDVAGVSKTYFGRLGAVHALSEVSLSVRRGSFVSLLGPSGCGKSTLLRIVAGLDTATNGRVTIEGSPVRAPRTELGVVFQSPLLLEWRDALGNVMLQAEAKKLPREQATARALALLESVGLKGSEHKRPHELSGGMQQRVAICRALLHDPAILLMDEPFGALDALTRDQMNLDLQRLWSQGAKTVLFVTHSISEAVFLSDRVIVMSPSPGRVSLDVNVDLPRPRQVRLRDDPQFIAYTRQIRQVFEANGVLRED
jgi:NitT/TauT family transport system ATP-binding protein